MGTPLYPLGRCLSLVGGNGYGGKSAEELGRIAAEEIIQGVKV